MKNRLLTLLVVFLVSVGMGVLTMWVIDVADGSAAQPSQHTAEVAAYYGVLHLCGGGSLVCVRRYPVKVFYSCGRNSKCWNVCYSHVERRWYLPRKFYRCSTGKISYRVGFLNYAWEY